MPVKLRPRDLKRTGPTEDEFLRQVLALAKLHGWRRAHFRPARTALGWRTAVSGDGAGFPDLVLLRGKRQVIAELKARRKKPEPAQHEWLAAFDLVGAEVYVWFPEKWPEIESVLQ